MLPPNSRHQLAQVARAAFDRFGGVERVGDAERGGGAGHQLGQARRARAAGRVGVEAGLLLDQAVEHGRVEPVARGGLRRSAIRIGWLLRRAAPGRSPGSRADRGRADDPGGIGYGGGARASARPLRSSALCRAEAKSLPLAAVRWRALAGMPPATRRVDSISACSCWTRCSTASSPPGTPLAPLPGRSRAAPAEARGGDLVEQRRCSRRAASRSCSPRRRSRRRLSISCSLAAVASSASRSATSASRCSSSRARTRRCASTRSRKVWRASRSVALTASAARTRRCAARRARARGARRPCAGRPRCCERREIASASSRWASCSLRSRTARTRSRRKRNEGPVTAWLSAARSGS